jgi:transcription elongation factor GreB
MSKAFTKEDDGVPQPLSVPRRAPLPDGVPNYVTPRGRELLRAERLALETERAALESNADETARALSLAAWTARINELEARIQSAVCVEPASKPSVVRFGSKVTVTNEAGRTATYEIVGVDEAEPPAGRIAFVSPLARALLGAEVGDERSVVTPGKPQLLEVLAID